MAASEPTSAHDRLAKYREMRDFARTPEPSTAEAEPSPGLPRFVIQEHHATALHWDFRLERDGVLVSWAIPKGLPLDPKTNHRAIHTEDHPLAYAEFEGDIPAGSYGAGRVIAWDHGTYETHKFRDDEVMVTLHGSRIHGRYILFPTGDNGWMVHRMDPPEDPGREPMPRHLAPMLCRPSKLPRDDQQYAFEVKWDGIRALSYVEGGRIRLESRNGLDITKQFPELRFLGESLGAREVVLDGEIVAPSESGAPSFERLQARLGLKGEALVRRRAKESPVVYMIFDVLYLDGRVTMPLPYRERRRLLQSLGLQGPSWRVSEFHEGGGAAMFEATKQQGLEGVVAKRLDSAYHPGKRTPAWLKVKHANRQELVIGGWTPGEGGRQSTLGAILVGHYDGTPDEAAARGEPQQLLFAGRVGSGFDEPALAALLARLRPLEQPENPFADPRDIPRESHFTRPEVVAEVEFTEWTRSGTLRHPVFKGLRLDKDPREIVREDTMPLDDTAAEPPPPTTPAAAPATSPRTLVEVEGHQLSLSNLDKVLYPAAAFTKAQVIDYYTRIAPVLLPHLQDRPLTLKRYPDGVAAPFFYEKECPSHRPPWVRTTPIWSESNRKTVNYCLANDLATVVWLANLATLELHPLLARKDDVQRPLSVVFDLDPGPPAGIVECARVALLLRELFDAFGLQTFAKTSGSKGMQVYLPLNTPVTYAETKPFAHAVAALLEGRHRDLVVSTMTKSQRAGKVFIDWSQNHDSKTTVSVYSLRAMERPTVSTPVEWAEVEAAASTGDRSLLSFEAAAVLSRVAAKGDLFAPMLTLEQALPSLSPG
ncbi:MAG: DNA ligase D [Chloroflexi bacterium]|nr:DNA ligase D [Chloroflexota bacterium]